MLGKVGVQTDNSMRTVIVYKLTPELFLRHTLKVLT